MSSEEPRLFGRVKVKVTPDFISFLVYEYALKRIAQDEWSEGGQEARMALEAVDDMRARRKAIDDLINRRDEADDTD